MAADLAAARLNMVESQVRPNDVTDVRIHDAMRAFPRESLLPADKAYLAYADTEVAYAPGRFLLKPRDVSKLLQALKPMPGERALAVAAPYAAAVLEALGVAVTTLDGEDLLKAPSGPYDIIVCEGATARCPQAWLDLLAEGGRAGLVERDGPVGKACLYVRGANGQSAGVGRRDLFDATPPVLPGFEARHGFAL